MLFSVKSLLVRSWITMRDTTNAEAKGRSVLSRWTISTLHTPLLHTGSHCLFQLCPALRPYLCSFHTMGDFSVVLVVKCCTLARQGLHTSTVLVGSLSKRDMICSISGAFLSLSGHCGQGLGMNCTGLWSLVGLALHWSPPRLYVIQKTLGSSEHPVEFWLG